MGFQIPKVKKTGLSAALEEHELQVAEQEKQNALTKPVSEYANPKDVEFRIRVVFDDSSSMFGEKIKDARDGTVEMMKNCALNNVAVAIHPMNSISMNLSHLTTNLPALSVLIQKLKATASTPLFETLKRAQSLMPKATRYIIFSDGEPDNILEKETCILQAIEEKTPFDTVLITHGSASHPFREGSSAYILLKELADRTGGIFMVFDRNKVNMKTGFKYLAPTQRLLLADPNFREALQEGRIK
jgi:Mg-chelatase subunit ChlD